MKNIGVFTSGGDSSGMNACIRAVVRAGNHFGKKVYGIHRGYEGLMDGDIVLLSDQQVAGISSLGGTILQSARSEKFKTKAGRALAYQNIKKLKLEGIVAIGGDGTFTGASIFTSEYPDIKMVGCPGTIDNDLIGTDFTIGYDTAINTVVSAIDKIRDTANSHNRLFFVEVMGRDAGFIALRSGISTEADVVMVPEFESDYDILVKKLKEASERDQRSYIVVVAEGDDQGGAFNIAQKIKKDLPSFDTKVSILGHMQRGGTPTAMERYRASQMGMEAVRALLKGRKSEMIGIVKNKICYTPFEKAIKHHKRMSESLTEMLGILSKVM